MEYAAYVGNWLTPSFSILELFGLALIGIGVWTWHKDFK
jgi:hypothetical protein